MPKSKSTATATKYASLQPHTTHISRARIQRTWRPLPPPAQERVKQLLLSLQKEAQAQRRNSNPTHTHMRKPKRKRGADDENAESAEDTSKNEEDQAVDEVVNRLIRRIPRMPFPKRQAKKLGNNNNNHNKNNNSYEADFDFEATLDRIQQVSADLAESIESTKLLREHIRREEAALQADRREYQLLEAGARSEQALAREQARKLHPLAREVYDDEKANETHDDDDNDDDDDDDDNDDDDFEFNVDADADADVSPTPDWADVQEREQKRKKGRREKCMLLNHEIEQDAQLKTLATQLRAYLCRTPPPTSTSTSTSTDSPGTRTGTGLGNALDDAEQSIWELLAASSASTR